MTFIILLYFKQDFTTKETHFCMKSFSH